MGLPCFIEGMLVSYFKKLSTCSVGYSLAVDGRKSEEGSRKREVRKFSTNANLEFDSP
ncbi:MAG: hypothetical protein ACI8YQ_005016 [Polaribacter sp.]|jgi:hypothetical protein